MLVGGREGEGMLLDAWAQNVLLSDLPPFTIWSRLTLVIAKYM
jgi:hypothetical protein